MYSKAKTVYDKVTNPFVIAGLILPWFFGISAHNAHAEIPDADILDDLSYFYKPVYDNLPAATAGIGTFTQDALIGTTTLGGNILTTTGLSTTATATATGLSTAFSFATGAVTVVGGIYVASKVTSAVFGAKPEPAAA